MTLKQYKLACFVVFTNAKNFITLSVSEYCKSTKKVLEQCVKLVQSLKYNTRPLFAVFLLQSLNVLKLVSSNKNLKTNYTVFR